MINRTIRHFSWIRDLWDVIPSRYRYRLAIVVVLAVLEAAADVLSVAMLVPITALLLQGGAGDNTVVAQLSAWTGITDRNKLMLFTAVAMLAIVTCRAVVKYIAHRARTGYVQGLGADLSRRVLVSYLTGPYAAHVGTDTAQRVYVAKGETYVLAGLVAELIALVALILNIVSMVGFALFLDPLLTIGAAMLVALIFGPAYVMLQRRLSRIGRGTFEHRQAMVSLVSQGLWNYREIVVFGMRRTLVDEFTRLANKFRILTIRGQMLRTTPSLLAEWIFGTLVGIGLLLYALSSGALAARLPSVVGLVIAGWRVLPQFVQVITKLAQLRINLPGVEAVRDALAFGSHKLESADKLDLSRSSRPAQISVRNVSFGYREQTERAVSDVTAELPAGRLIGVFGPSGAGKSTMMNVLLGFLQPQQGEVTANGVSIFEDLDAWRARIGFVAQDPVLLTSTIRKNIVFGRKRPDEEERLRRVLEFVHLDKFVESLPKNVDSAVGERGTLLSGGQRQRVAIARALYAEPALLILDEPASALDPTVAAAIDESLEALRGQATVIVVTHRPATIERCDLILYIDQGRLRGSGTFRELMEHPDFSQLVRAALLSDEASASRGAPDLAPSA